jgi:hypothetical protein
MPYSLQGNERGNARALRQARREAAGAFSCLGAETTEPALGCARRASLGVMHLADWDDPETWRTIALAITAVVGAITAVVCAIAAATKKGRQFIARWWKAIRGSRRPRADLRIVASDLATFWSNATLGDERVISFHGTFYATNRERVRRLALEVSTSPVPNRTPHDVGRK